MGRVQEHFLKASKAPLLSQSYSTINANKNHSKIGNFTLFKSKYIPSLALTAHLYKHAGGAQAMHLQSSTAASQINKAFSIAFRTPPEDSRGAPHILEHSVLCGSQLYPVKDPFFKMLNRSLSNYMNAWTGQDWTMYPFLCTNLVDFGNLRSVYLDAVFRPLLRLSDFQQEGWRITEDGRLMGVVYNEMKGVFADRESLFHTRWQQSMFPNTHYAHVSGGDPACIPHLSHEDLKAFHQKHYDPSNALLFSQGNIDLNEHFAAIEPFLEKQNYAHPNEREAVVRGTEHGLQNSFSEPKTIYQPSPPHSGNGKEDRLMILQSHLSIPSTDHLSALVMKVASSLLFDGPDTFFHRALLASGLGAEWAPGTGFDSSTLSSTLNVGLQGSKSCDHKKILQVIEDTFSEIIRNGIPSSKVASSLAQLKLSLLQHTPMQALGLAQRSTQAWTHHGCPIAAIDIDEQLGLFDEQMIIPLIKQTVIGNPHTLTFIEDPQTDFVKKQEEQENLLSKQLMGSDEYKGIDNSIANHHLIDNDGDSENLLPCLAISEIERKATLSTLFPKKANDVFERIWTRESDLVPADHVYLKIKIPLALNGTSSSLLPLLTACLDDALIGTHGKELAQLYQEIKLCSTGINISPFIDQDGKAFLWISSFTNNLQQCLGLIEEIILSSDWSNTKQIETLIGSSKVNTRHSVVSEGHSYAISQSCRGLGSYGDAVDSVSGFGFAQYLLQDHNVNVATIQKAWDAINFDENDARIALIHNSQDNLDYKQCLDQLRAILASKKGNSTLSTPKFSPTPQNGRNTIVQVKGVSATAHTALSTSIDSSNAKCCAAMSIASQILRHKYLHPRIREQGGAYGAGCTFSPTTGILSLYSYRDPSPTQSLTVMRASIGEASKDPISEQEMIEGRLGVFGGLDAPRAVGSEHLEAFKWNLSDSRRQALRDALLTVTSDDIHEALKAINVSDMNSCIVTSGKTQGNHSENVTLIHLE